jgi:3-deoxy-D-manno-octulosonate 8-phosphate phosphatase (KDO 8-P phosphatase)
MSSEIENRQSKIENIRLLAFDVDGVFTDGKLSYGDDGTIRRAFDIKDGMAIRLAREAGLITAVLTAKVSAATRQRMADLKIDHVFEGFDSSGGTGGKGAGIEKLAAQAGVALEHTAYMGDDLMDLPALNRVAYPMCPADAVAEVKAVCAYVSDCRGGYGAVRDAVAHVLKAQGHWEGLVARYGGKAQGH